MQAFTLGIKIQIEWKAKGSTEKKKKNLNREKEVRNLESSISVFLVLNTALRNKWKLNICLVNWIILHVIDFLD